MFNKKHKKLGLTYQAYPEYDAKLNKLCKDFIRSKGPLQIIVLPCKERMLSRFDMLEQTGEADKWFHSVNWIHLKPKKSNPVPTNQSSPSKQQSQTPQDLLPQFFMQAAENIGLLMKNKQYTKADKLFVDSLRVCDSVSYGDTLTFSYEFMRNIPKVLETFYLVTRGGFLTVPCRVEYDSTSKNWVWQHPMWFEHCHYYTFATFLASQFETYIWKRFWDANRHLDPRVVGTTKKYPTTLLSFNNNRVFIPSVWEFWAKSSMKERIRIIKRLIKEAFISRKATLVQKFGPNAKKGTNMGFGSLVHESDMTLIPKSDRKMSIEHFDELLLRLISILPLGKLSSDSFVHTLRGKLPVNLKGKPCSFNELVLDCKDDFVQFLFSSRLNRVHKACDKLIRYIAEIFHEEYAQDVLVNLGLEFEDEKNKKEEKNKKSKAKQAKKNKQKAAKKEEEQRIRLENEKKRLEGEEKLRKMEDNRKKEEENRLKVLQTQNDDDEEGGEFILMTPTKSNKTKKKKKKKNKSTNKSTNNNNNNNNITLNQQSQQSQQQTTKSKIIKENKQNVINKPMKEVINKPIKEVESKATTTTTTTTTTSSASNYISSSINKNIPYSQIVATLSSSSTSTEQQQHPLSSSASNNSINSNTSNNTRSRSSSSPSVTEYTSLVTPPWLKGVKQEHVARFYAYSSHPSLQNTETQEDNRPRQPHMVKGGRGYLSSVQGSVSNTSIKRLLGAKPEHSVLHDEIVLFETYNTKQTKQRRVLADGIVEKLNNAMQSFWPGLNIETYGSMVTGLGLQHSDLDIVITGFENTVIKKNSKGKERKFSISSLVKVLDGLSWVEKVTGIESARVPVIKIVASADYKNNDEKQNNNTSRKKRNQKKKNTLVVDITFDHSGFANVNRTTLVRQPIPCHYKSVQSPCPYIAPISTDCFYNCNKSSCPHSSITHTGLSAAKLIREFMLSLPSLKYIAIVLKQYLHERGLSNTYTGGISSYCLILMIVAFLKQDRLEKHKKRVQIHTNTRRKDTTEGEGKDDNDDNDTSSSFLPYFNYKASINPINSTTTTTTTESNQEGSGIIPDDVPVHSEFTDYGELLILLLDFYSTFDFHKMGILPLPTVPGQSCFYRLVDDSATLVMADPFNPSNNIGKSVFAMHNIQHAFKDAHNLLHQAGSFDSMRNNIFIDKTKEEQAVLHKLKRGTLLSSILRDC